MARILIVDDSAVDRQMIEGILEEATDFECEFATDGDLALEQIERTPPDLVLTDLVMPRLDGLELVTTVRRDHPAIPVVLMTSKGSAKIAADALVAGASSYVPKTELLNSLIDTIRNVLAVSAGIRSHERLMENLRRRRVVFDLPNDSTHIASLVGFVQDQVAFLGLCDEAEQIRFGVALEEALSNAMYHGNLEADSCLKEEDANAFDQLVGQRRREAPYCDRRIFVDADLEQDKAVVVVRDEGPGFDPSSLLDPTDPENLDRVHGRGVLLMRTFMDEVQFSERGNQVTLIKRRQTAPAS
ncbi:MAG: response regulator [Planctomycetales bacterium]|nr:response regulator [Planctomycetales bacterium]NIP68023.1 response regulator [Planctomycetales bacterium]